MAVYVDDAAILWKGKRRYHMTADSLDELHAFAGCLGIHRCWFHKPRAHPHYDLTEDQRLRAVRAGALEVNRRELLTVARNLAR